MTPAPTDPPPETLADELRRATHLCEQLRRELDQKTQALRDLEEQHRLAFQEIAGLKARLEQENAYLREEIKAGHDFGHLIGISPALKEVRQAVLQVARTDSTVLIAGADRWCEARSRAFSPFGFSRRAAERLKPNSEKPGEPGCRAGERLGYPPSTAGRHRCAASPVERG